MSRASTADSRALPTAVGVRDEGIIVAEDLSIQFVSSKGEAFVAVNGVNLTIERGKFVVVIGPSGCGKSTVLNAIAGLVRPARGSIYYDGDEVKGVNTACGYITQNDTLLPWATVEGNVELGLRVRGVPKRERRQRVDEVLRMVDLHAFKSRFPAQLSGGMRKRALLARTVVYEPETLLMDEPFGALDAQLRMRLQQDLLNLWERERKTVVFVTHDLDEALLLADEIVVFGGKPGRIVHRQQVHLPRPRDPLSLREDPQFWALWRQLWHYIDPAEQAVAEDGRVDE